MAERGARDYEHALRNARRFQEEPASGWGRILNQATAPEQWQQGLRRLTALTSSLLPMAQRRAQEVLDLMTENGRAGAELMQKAFDAAQTPEPAQSQAKWLEFWTSSLKAVQSSTAAVTQISTRTINSWMEFVRKNTELTGIRVPKPA